MSGGVDSSVAAALLKKKAEVSGVFLKLFSSKDFQESEKKARKIAGILKIPFFVLDLRKEFKKEIIDSFLLELKRGKTPNPCVLCNDRIKFGILFEKIKKIGMDFDFIASGHYVRKVRSKSVDKLVQAKDKTKDQSYFLWRLKQKQLEKLLFPIGNYTKKEVKRLGKDFGLPLFSRESQEICFIQKDLDYFLRKHLGIKKGDIINQGKIISKHNGLWFYTIGQRKSIGLAGGPYYVLDKEIKKNNLIVAKDQKKLYKKELSLNKVNWISGKPELPLKAKVKIRYRQKAFLALIKDKKIEFEKPQKAITAGQSAVFYKGKQVLGGGIIA